MVQLKTINNIPQGIGSCPHEYDCADGSASFSSDDLYTLRCGSGGGGSCECMAAILLVTQQADPNQNLFDVTANGSIYGAATDIVDATTPGTEALLTYAFWMDGVLLYSGEIAPDADPIIVGNWTITAGTRSVAQFTTEVIGNIQPAGSGFAFTLDKFSWASDTLFWDDGLTGNTRIPLDIQLTVKNVGNSNTATTVINPDYHRMDLQKRDATFKRMENLMWNFGEIWGNDNTGDVIFRIIDDPDFGPISRMIAGQTPLPPSGASPWFNETKTGNNSWFNNPHGLSPAWEIINGYQTAHFCTQFNYDIVRLISRNTNNSIDERENWDIFGLDGVSASPGNTNAPRWYEHPVLYNGYKAYWRVNANFNLNLWHYATTLNGFPVNAYIDWLVLTPAFGSLTYPFRHLRFTDKHNIVTVNMDTGLVNIVMYELTGSDIAQTADWRARHVAQFPAAGFYTGYFELTRNVNGMPTIYYLDDLGQVHEITYNGGTALTIADWDVSIVATIPGFTANNLSNLVFDQRNNLYVGDYTDLWKVNLDTYSVEHYIGSGSEPLHTNSIIY